MLKNRTGFALLEILLIILMIAVIGLGGYYVYNNQHKQPVKPNVTSNKPASTSSTIDNGFKDGPKTGWKTYTNNKAGFSIAVPITFESSYGSPCVKTDDSYTGYVSYRPVSGTVPTTIVEDGTNFYITEDYTYQLAGAADHSGYTDYSSCNKTNASVALVKEYEAPKTANSPLLTVIPVSVTSANNPNDVVDWAQHFFNDTTITASMASSNGNAWKDVTLDCKPAESDTCMDFNYKFFLRYYEKQHKLVYIALGQAGKLAKPGTNDYYDLEVVDSFKVLD